WAVVLIVAVTAWLLEASRWWSVAAIVLGTVLSLRLLQMIVDPPYLVWEGQTSSGTPTGGMEVAYPALGFGLWVLGSLCFIAAGVCGLIPTPSGHAIGGCGSNAACADPMGQRHRGRTGGSDGD